MANKMLWQFVAFIVAVGLGGFIAVYANTALDLTGSATLWTFLLDGIITFFVYIGIIKVGGSKLAVTE